MPGALHREGAGEAEEACLRRRVARLPEAAQRARDRGHVDDPAPAAFAEMRPHRLCAVEGAREVDAQVALPELRRLVVELRRVVERAGVVDEDVDRAELLDRTRDRGVDLRAIGDVAADGDRLAPEPADLVDRLLSVHEPLLPCHRRERTVAIRLLRELRLDEKVGDDHVGSRLRERQRVGAPEPARTAGDERDASAQVDLERHRLDPNAPSNRLLHATRCRGERAAGPYTSGP